jgi:serine/threonine protein kinase
LALERDSRLGKYRIRERIGAGGMGIVYRAFDTVLRRRVALKTILTDKAADREFLTRFRREALAVSQIDHPHIVRLFDFIEADPKDDEPSYMVMEFLPGRDLGRLVRKGALEITRAVDILLETCAAVGTCHRYGFVHRDLKPTNIFVAEYDQIEAAKVLDFGAAKAWGKWTPRETEFVELTRKGAALGTPEFLAPEILQGGPATPKSDQYALGVVLYTVLAGRKPFASDESGEFKEFLLWQAIVRGEHPRLRTYRPEVADRLDAIAERAMQVDPAKRFTDVHAMGGALLEWASAPARLRWTAHFTSAPRHIDRQHSTASEPLPHDVTISLTPRTLAVIETQATVPVGDGHPRQLRDGGFGRAADAIDRRSTARTFVDDIDGPSSSEADPSIPIVVEDHVGPAVQDPKAPGREVVHRSSIVSRLGRRPVLIIGTTGGALVVAVLGAMLLHRSKPALVERAAPPATFFSSRSQAVAPPETAGADLVREPATQVQEVQAGSKHLASPVVARRPAHRRRPPILDENGIGIPRD